MPNAAPVTTTGTDGVQQTNETTPLAQSIIANGFTDSEAVQVEKFLLTMQAQSLDFTAFAESMATDGEWTAETRDKLAGFLATWQGEAVQDMLTEGKIAAAIEDSLERAGGVCRDTASTID